jgi:acetoacetyl-CoA synthetase
MNTSPTTQPPFIPQIRLYQQWLAEHRQLHFDDYQAMWHWSVTHLEDFWQSAWDYLDLQSPTPHQCVLERNTMPGARWFVGAQVNYAQQVLRHVDAAHAAGMPAIIGSNERGQRRELSWPELKRQAAALSLHLRAQGVQPGDRVAAYLPNIPETMVAFLAVVSIGAIWSVCAPDMGTHAVVDRFKQITPKVLIAVDGVTYGGKDLERHSVVAELRQALPSVQHVVIYRNLGDQPDVPHSTDWQHIMQRHDEAVQAFTPMWMPFNHPLWIVYSSGTTGLPKPLVHDHGGTMLNGMAHKNLHYDVACSYEPNSWGERFLWYSSTGWVMWNAQLSGLLSGTTCVIYDGNPGGTKERPDWGVLWRYAASEHVTFFGGGAAFFTNCMKAGVQLHTIAGLQNIRALGTTGSPLSAEVQQWGTTQFHQVYAAAGEAPEDIWWCNISGGTDAGAYVGGHRELPMVAGEMQCRFLGVSVQAWNEQGKPVIDEVGELVVTQPLPCMPPFFWGDTDNQRYIGSYFDTFPPGQGRQPSGGDLGPEAGSVWRHGDWLKITPEGRAIIYGRSDATINRYGLRMGTSELYSAVEALPEVLDSMVVDLEYLGKESYMPLFVVLRPDVVLDEALRVRLNGAIRTALSPRFVPNHIFQVAEIPRTLSGKKQELPIKKLMLGQPVEKVLNRDAMANPACLDWYIALAKKHLAGER